MIVTFYLTKYKKHVHNFISMWYNVFKLKIHIHLGGNKMYEALVQTLIDSKEKGLKIVFKTDGANYFVYIANGLFATLNKKEFDKFHEKWKSATTLLYQAS